MRRQPRMHACFDLDATSVSTWQSPLRDTPRWSGPSHLSGCLASNPCRPPATCRVHLRLLVPVAIFRLWYRHAGCRRVPDIIDVSLERGALRRLAMDGPRLSWTDHPPFLVVLLAHVLLDATAMWAGTSTNALPRSSPTSCSLQHHADLRHWDSGSPSSLVCLGRSRLRTPAPPALALPEQTSHSPLGARVMLGSGLAAPPRTSAVASLLAVQGPWAALPQ